MEILDYPMRFQPIQDGVVQGNKEMEVVLHWVTPNLVTPLCPTTLGKAVGSREG